MLYDAKEGELRSGKGELSKSDVGEQKSSYLRKCWTSIRTTRELIVLYYEYPKGSLGTVQCFWVQRAVRRAWARTQRCAHDERYTRGRGAREGEVTRWVSKE